MVTRKESPEEKAFDAVHAEAEEKNQSYSGIVYVTKQMNLLMSSIIVTAMMEAANQVRKAFDSEGNATQESMEFLNDAGACLMAAEEHLKRLSLTFGEAIHSAIPASMVERDAVSAYPSEFTAEGLLSKLSRGVAEDSGRLAEFLTNFARKALKDSLKASGKSVHDLTGRRLIGFDVTSEDGLRGYVEDYSDELELYRIHLHDGSGHLSLYRNQFVPDEI